jgi:hypothetical protein
MTATLTPWWPLLGIPVVWLWFRVLRALGYDLFPKESK